VTEAHLQAIRKIADQHSGATPMTLCVQLDSGEKVFLSTHRDHYIHVSHELVLDLEHLLGEDCVYVESNPTAMMIESKKKRWQKKG
jgi:hypothetical protein